jgi:oligoribonuclease NrnB/cAMP/cGMP phosphodiesterase (DHH superfamily)
MTYNPKILCIYHANCQDGFTAYWIYSRCNPDLDIEGFEGNYGDEAPDVKDRDVVILDFSYPRDTMVKIINDCRSLLVLDHHKSAELNLKNLPLPKDKDIKIIFNKEESGASLAYKHFNKSGKPSILVETVKDRDLFIFRHTFTRQISAYMFSLPYTLESWDHINQSLENRASHIEICELGDALIQQKNQNIDLLIKNNLYYTAFSLIAKKYDKKIRLISAVNCPVMYGSDLCAKFLERQSVDVALYFNILNTGNIYVGLRSLKGTIDVSKLATAFGGGGHENASGFIINPYSSKSMAHTWKMIQKKF